MINCSNSVGEFFKRQRRALLPKDMATEEHRANLDRSTWACNGWLGRPWDQPTRLEPNTDPSSEHKI